MIQGWAKYLNMKTKLKWVEMYGNPFGLGKCENLTGHQVETVLLVSWKCLAFKEVRL